ncbi:MAG TPA: hypothetical protein VHL59_12430 [Thermoanaerobaculia bacterium]|nr:hypothetical protein [Thermoanaerobaculia bacterium]
MSDEFGTVNLRRGERSREIEILRQHYRRHRESLVTLIADAPTEHLATEYRRLMQEIDVALVKLDEIEGRASGPVPSVPPPPPPSRPATQPGMRPLVTPAVPQEEPASMAYDEEDADAARDSRLRLVLIAVAAVIALAAIGWLIWRSSAGRG